MTEEKTQTEVHTWDAKTLNEQPKNISKTLFRHQRKSVYDMEKLEKKEGFIFEKRRPGYFGGEHRLVGSFGLQCDPVGYGKTLSMVTLISRDKMEWNTNEKHKTHQTYNDIMYRREVVTEYVRVNSTIIICSLSCVSQWVGELSNSDLSVVVIKRRVDIEKYTIVADIDVILVTATMYNSFMDKHSPFRRSAVAWKRLIFDEPAQVKISAIRRGCFGFVWLVTATPEGIRYCQPNGSWIGESVKNMERHCLRGYFVIKNPNEFVEMSFEMPKTYFRDYVCWQPLVRYLNGIVPVEINRMLQAGDIQGAIEKIGGSTASHRDIISIIRKRKEMDLRFLKFKLETWRNHLQHNTSDLSDSQIRLKIKHFSGRCGDLMNQIDKLEEDNYKKILDTNCPICLDDVQNGLMEPLCGNIFCGECLLKWCVNNKNCPICRSEIKPTDLIHITETRHESKSQDDGKKPQTKLECIRKIFIRCFEDNKKSSVIVASQYIGMYKKIQSILSDLNISWCEIHGHVASREKNIKKFKTGTTNVIFLSHLESTAGVNLTEATDVILYNEMPLALRSQIIGRANRVGRKDSLTVHTLFVDNGFGAPLVELN